MSQSGRQNLPFLVIMTWILRLGLVIATIGLVAYMTGPNDYIPGIRQAVTQQEPMLTITKPFSEMIKGPVSVEQDNPLLLQHIRERYLIPPAEGPYKLNSPESNVGHADAVREVLNNMTGGFYVECGAFDGETWSNSLLFEKEFEWSGILIEAETGNFKSMMQKRRKAWGMHACLSTRPYPVEVMFKWGRHAGKIASEDTSKVLENMEKIQCFPLYSVLLALNITTLHFFSLDVEGSELDVLKTIPWKDVDIWVLLIEYINMKDGRKVLGEYLEPLGYVSITEVSERNRHLFNYDTLFVRRDVLDKLNSKKT